MADNKDKKVLNVPALRFPEFTEEWEKVRLGNNCNIQMCKRIMAAQTNTEGGVPFYKIGTIGGKADAYISKDLFDEYKMKYSFPHKGEVMITCAGTVGKCIIYNGEDSYYQDSNIVWIDNPDKIILNDFLYHLLSRINWSRLNSTTIVRIYNDDLRNLKLYCPRHDEQKKITKFLSLIDKRIETQNKIIEDLRLLRDAISVCLLSPKSDWKCYKVSEIADIGRGRVISSKEIANQNNPRYPVYSSQTSNEGIMGYLDDYAFDGEYITWTTDGANAGTVFYRNGRFNCTNVCGTLKLHYQFDAYYCSLVLANATKKYVSVNLANPKLMNNTMAAIKLYLPPFQEQKRMPQLFRKMDENITLEHKLLLSYQKQKYYLLQQMFI